MVAVLARPPDGLTVACAVRELELRLALAGTPRGCVTGNLQLCSPARSCSARQLLLRSPTILVVATRGLQIRSPFTGEINGGSM
nr:unnamed protein product [Digitaria exilis]